MLILKNTIHQSKAWAYTTAFIMSFNGGYINSICMLTILGIPVGYVTGNLTIGADAMAKGDSMRFLYLIVLVFCFLIGSVLSSLLVKSQNFKMDRRYATSIILQFLTLSCAIILLNHHNQNSGYFLALTMGMQNAMTTHYGSALIRTTHMTGTTTDLGILIGRWIKGESIEYWKICLYISLIFGFACGAIAGALLYPIYKSEVLLLSFVFYFFMIGWPVFKKI